MVSIRNIGRSKKGQALVELTLLSPLLLLMAYGAVEVGNVISTYITLTHTTREGANLASRGTAINVVLDAITAAAAPTLRDDNVTHWKIIYSKVVQDPGVPCAQAPCVYKVSSQTERGSMGQSSKLGPVNQTVTLSGINSVGPGQTFHVVEVFYDYQSAILTFVGSQMDPTIYDRTIFTNVSNGG